MKQLTFPLQGETYLVNDFHSIKENGKVVGYKITSYNRHTLNRLRGRCSNDAEIKESFYTEGLYNLITSTLDSFIIHKVDTNRTLVESFSTLE